MDARVIISGLGIARVVLLVLAVPAVVWQRVIFRQPSHSVGSVCHDDYGMFWSSGEATIPFCIVYATLCAAASALSFVAAHRTSKWSSLTIVGSINV
eukprot:m51a1_g9677 hypothetical protein (97) ;mRNA; f:1286473-1288279